MLWGTLSIVQNCIMGGVCRGTYKLDKLRRGRVFGLSHWTFFQGAAGVVLRVVQEPPHI